MKKEILSVSEKHEHIKIRYRRKRKTRIIICENCGNKINQKGLGDKKMKTIAEKLTAILIISMLVSLTNAATGSDRIRLKNGEAKVKFDLKPGESKQFVISGKQFKTMKVSLRTSSKQIHVQILSPKSKTLASGLRKNFTVKNVGSGDYRINLKNRDKSSVVGSYLVVGEIKG